MKVKKITIEITGPTAGDCKIMIDGRSISLIQHLYLSADATDNVIDVGMARYNQRTSQAETLNIEWEK